MSILQPTQRTLHIGTRSSALALAQTNLFTTLLSTLPSAPATSIHPTTTTGDKNQTSSLHALADATGKSLWTHELEAQLLAGEIDCIVHSLKDVPTKLVAGCVVRAVGAREDPRDVLVVRAERREGEVKTLQELLDTGGGTVGTSSVRRAAMIRRQYPGLKIKDVRGNVGTRLRKLDTESEGYDCLVLAGAGVLRLGLGNRIASWVGREDGMLHAVGQGALGVEFREGDERVEGFLAGVRRDAGGRRVEWECAAERMLLGCLEGGCSVPVGVETEWEDDEDEANMVSEQAGKKNEGKVEAVEKPGGGARQEGQKNEKEESTGDSHAESEDGGILIMRAMVLSVDGSECVEGERRQRASSTAAAEECGFELAKELVVKGARRILEKITLNRGLIQAQDGA